MCSSIKSDPAISLPKKRYRSFMASMTLAQRAQFADVANRADERRHIREISRRRHAKMQSLIESTQMSGLDKFMKGFRQLFA